MSYTTFSVHPRSRNVVIHKFESGIRRSGISDTTSTMTLAGVPIRRVADAVVLGAPVVIDTIAGSQGVFLDAFAWSADGGAFAYGRADRRAAAVRMVEVDSASLKGREVFSLSGDQVGTGNGPPPVNACFYRWERRELLASVGSAIYKDNGQGSAAVLQAASAGASGMAIVGVLPNGKFLAMAPDVDMPPPDATVVTVPFRLYAVPSGGQTYRLPNLQSNLFAIERRSSSILGVLSIDNSAGTAVFGAISEAARSATPILEVPLLEHNVTRSLPSLSPSANKIAFTAIGSGARRGLPIVVVRSLPHRRGGPVGPFENETVVGYAPQWVDDDCFVYFGPGDPARPRAFANGINVRLEDARIYVRDTKSRQSRHV